ncbi:MAG: GIY-YIG nuclease family protein [Chthoniobacterales bacterium]
MSAFYRVYVLRSSAGRFYIGLSEESVASRLAQHHTGQSRWTKGKGPWAIAWQSETLSLADARKLESLLKRQKGGDGFYKIIGLVRESAP